MSKYLLLDTGPWVATIDSGDDKHKTCIGFIKQFKGQFLSTYPVLTEALYLLNDDIRSQQACFDWIRCGAVKLINLETDMLERAEKLMVKYKDVPMDFADATLVSLAENVGLNQIFTLDRKGFTTFKLQGKKSFELAPR